MGLAALMSSYSYWDNTDNKREYLAKHGENPVAKADALREALQCAGAMSPDIFLKLEAALEEAYELGYGDGY